MSFRRERILVARLRRFLRALHARQGVHRREDRRHHADPVVVISSINSGRTVLRREQMATALARRRVCARPESGAEGGHLDCSATSSSTSAPEVRFHVRSRVSSWRVPHVPPAFSRR